MRGRGLASLGGTSGGKLGSLDEETGRGGGLLPVAYSGPWGGSPGSPDSQQRGGRSQGGAKVLAAWEGTTTAAVTAGAGARWGLEMENVDSLAGVQSHRVRPCH